jgi:hypothetical protein
MRRIASALIALVCVTVQAQAQTSSPEDLNRRAIERRAIEAVNWGMSAVNFDLMYQSMVKTGGKYNQVVYWSRLPDWKIQTLTPNPDTIYFSPFIDTKDVGPVVIEIPPAEGGGSITGTIMDAWQGPLEDVGPAGVDQGRGGKYLILPQHLFGSRAGRLHRTPVIHVSGLCALALQSGERQRCRRG